MKQLRSILAYDAEWPSHEFTEQHALFQVEKMLPAVPGALYLGFPWTTLIERVKSKELSADQLEEVIHAAKPPLNEQKYVVTECQR